MDGVVGRLGQPRLRIVAAGAEVAAAAAARHVVRVHVRARPRSSTVAVPIGLPYLITGSPTRDSPQRDLVSGRRSARVTVTASPPSVDGLPRLERLERGRDVVALADDEHGLHWLTPLARKPPSTASTWPVTNDAASEARNTAAPTSSSILPKRFIGVRMQELLPARRVEQRRVEVGAEHARRDRIHGDVVRRPFDRQRARQPGDRRLARDVGRDFEQPDERRQRGDGDDPAGALRDHRRGRTPGSRAACR